MRLYRPEQERPADAALTALLPPGESRRLPDTELSELVGRIAQAVPVRPQNRKFREDVIQDVVLEGLRLGPRSRTSCRPSRRSSRGSSVLWPGKR